MQFAGCWSEGGGCGEWSGGSEGVGSSVSREFSDDEQDEIRVAVDAVDLSRFVDEVDLDESTVRFDFDATSFADYVSWLESVAEQAARN